MSLGSTSPGPSIRYLSWACWHPFNTHLLNQLENVLTAVSAGRTHQLAHRLLESLPTCQSCGRLAGRASAGSIQISSQGRRARTVSLNCQVGKGRGNVQCPNRFDGHLWGADQAIAKHPPMSRTKNCSAHNAKARIEKPALRSVK